MSLARDITTVGSATLVSRLLAFARDVGIAAMLGAGALSDAYFAAAQIPNLFRRLLADGALNAAFAPMWLRQRANGDDAARRFGEGVLGTMLAALGIAAVAGILFAPLIIRLLAPGFGTDGERFGIAVELVRLSLPYIALAGVGAVAAAILNAEGRVGAAAFAIAAFNVVLVAAVIVIFAIGSGATRLSAYILAASFVVAGTVQLILLVRGLTSLPRRPRHVKPSTSHDVRRFYSRAIPGVIAAGTPQLMLIAGTIIASASPAAVSWLTYANRLYELPLGVITAAIATVLAPRIAASFRAQTSSSIALAQARTFEIALGLALPAAVGMALLAQPIARVLFERGAFGPTDSVAVAAALMAIACGLPGHALEKAFGAISFSHEDTRAPMVSGLAGIAIATVAAVLLFPRYGHVGIAAAIALSGWIGAALMGIVLMRRRWIACEPSVVRRLAGIVLAAAIMGAVVAGGQALFANASTGSALARAAILAVLIAAGLAAYLASLHVLGIAPLRDLIRAAKTPSDTPLAP